MGRVYKAAARHVKSWYEIVFGPRLVKGLDLQSKRYICVPVLFASRERDCQSSHLCQLKVCSALIYPTMFCCSECWYRVFFYHVRKCMCSSQHRRHDS